jgi:hypothetical protein
VPRSMCPLAPPPNDTPRHPGDRNPMTGTDAFTTADLVDGHGDAPVHCPCRSVHRRAR